MSRQARTRSSLALGLIVFLVAGLWLAGRQVARASDAQPRRGDSASAGSTTTAVVVPLPSEFKGRLLRAGLTPRALAAAGIGQGSVLATLQAAADQMNGAPMALDSADGMYAAARVAADALARKIQSGKATQEEVASYPAAKAAVEAAEAARQSVLDGYFSAATANLTANQRAALTMIRANRRWGFPDEYLVAERTEAQWIALRDALSNEHQSAELPDMTSEAATQLLATVRGEPSVSFASTSVQTGLPLITNAWNTAVGD
jgi:hypothetical protein